jgi:hypothetical protein
VLAASVEMLLNVGRKLSFDCNTFEGESLMKSFFLSGFAAAALIAISGCPASKTGGGASTSKEDKFSIDKVILPTTVKQGGADDVKIALNRGRDFKQTVKLTAEKVPDKVRVDFNPPVIKASDEPNSVIKITADKEAALGEHTIVVKGTPDTGDPTTIDVKIKVTAP